MFLNYQVSFILTSMHHAYNSLSKSTYQCIFNILVSTQPPAYSVYSKQVQVVLCDKIHADKQVNSTVNNVNKQKLRAFFFKHKQVQDPTLPFHTYKNKHILPGKTNKYISIPFTRSFSFSFSLSYSSMRNYRFNIHTLCGS